jgi:hypothetical protein
LATDTYGIDSCSIQATDDDLYSTNALATGLNMCDFPYHSFSSNNFVGKIGL